MRLIISCWMLSGILLAALPPLSESERESQAKHIFEGVVREVRAQLVSDGDSLNRQDWQYTAQVFIHKVLKGDLEEKTSIDIVFWNPSKRPWIWVGSQGQDQIPDLGNKGRFFVDEVGSTVIGPGPLSLLTPNGWELLKVEDDSWKINVEL